MLDMLVHLKRGNNEQIAPVLAVVETAGKRSGVLRGRPTPTFALGNCLQGDYFETNFSWNKTKMG